MSDYNALAPYYGSKRQLAGRIIEALGAHTAYWEPFCGSLAVLLAKNPCRMEVANDLNRSIINLAMVVQDDILSVELFERLNRTVFCEKLYTDAVEWLYQYNIEVNTPPVLEWAYNYFVAGWMGRNGFVGTTDENKGFCKRHTSTGGDPATRFRNVVARIPAWWERLRNVTILSEDGLLLLDRIEDRNGTAIYCDPPYLTKQADYIHDFTRVHHGILAAVLRRFKKTKVVVSYYEHPVLEDLYIRYGWRMVRLDVNKNLSATAKKAPEVLLVNGD